jgi:hypothetical protein
MSKNAGKSEMKESNALMRDNIAKLEALGIPTIEAQKIALQNPELVGLLEAEQLGPSALEGMQEDPRLAGSRMSALEGITSFAEQGYDAESRALEEASLRRAANLGMATMASGEQRLASEGMSDSGSRLLNMQAAAQNAAETQSQAGLQMAANAAAARRQALGQQADMASNMSAQNLGMQEKKLSAADSIASFNAQNKQNVNAQNLGARQNIANQKTANVNQQEIYNKGLQQQKFQNEVAKAGGVSQANTAMAGNLQQQAAAAQQAQQALTSSIIGAGTSVAGAYAGKK